MHLAFLSQPGLRALREVLEDAQEDGPRGILAATLSCAAVEDEFGRRDCISGAEGRI